MDNNLSLLISARMDLTKTEESLNSQIKSLESKINKLNIKINIDSSDVSKITSGLTNIQKTVSSSGSKIKILDATEIDFYQRKMTDMLNKLKIGKDTVFTKSSIQNETSKFTEELSKVGTIGGKSTKELGLQFSKLSTSVRSASNEITKINKDADSFGTTFSKDILKLGIWSAAAAIMYSPLRGMKDAISYLNELDNSLNQIRIVTGLSQIEVEKLAKSYNSLAKQMSVSTKEIAAQAVDLYRQGLQGTDVDERMQAIIKYAKISSISLQDSNDIITASVNGTKANVNELIDVFSYMGDKSATGADEIGKAFQKTASVASTAGVEYRKLASYIATVSSVTRNSSETIGNSFKSLLSRYQSIKERGFNDEDATNINQVTKALKDLSDQTGFDINAIDTQTGQLRNYTDVLDDLSKVWDKLNPKQKEYIQTTMAGVYQADKFAALMSNYTQSVQLYTGALGSVGTANQKFSTWQESTSARLEKLTAVFQDFYSKILNSNEIKALIDGFTNLVSTFGNLHTIIPLVLSGILLFKGASITSSLILGFTNLGQSISKAGGFLKLAETNLNKYSFETQKATLMARGMTEAEALLKVQTVGAATGFKALGQSITTAFLSNPVGIILTALTSVIMIVDIFNQKQEESKQKAEEQIQKYKQEASTLNELGQQYTDIIKAGNLTEESKTRLKSIQDQLIKTYDIEKDKLDLVNGSYKDQINLIDEAFFKKQQAIKNAMGSSGENAKDFLTKNGSTSLTTSITGKVNEVDIENEVKKLSGFGGRINSKLGFAVSFEGNPEERLKSLGSLINTLQNVQDKSNTLKKIITELSGEYNNLDSKIKENRKTWDEYAKADFYTKFKSQISQVHDLESQFEKESNDNKKVVLKSQIENIKNSITSNSGYISDYKGFVEDLFNFIIDKSKDTGNATSGIFKSITEDEKTFNQAIQDADKAFKDSVSNVQSLSTAQQELSDNNKLSSKTLKDLLLQYPQLIQYLDDEKELSKQISKLIESEQENQRKLYEAKLSLSTDYFNIYIKNNVDTWNIVKDAYGSDYQNFKTVADAKKVTNDLLVKAIGKSWSEIYQTEEDALRGILTYSYSDMISGKSNPAMDAVRQKAQKQLAALEAINAQLDKSTGKIDFKTLDTKDNKGSGSSSDFNQDYTKEYMADVEKINDKIQQLNNEYKTLENRNASVLDLNKKLDEVIAAQILKQKALNTAVSDMTTKRNTVGSQIKGLGIDPEASQDIIAKLYKSLSKENKNKFTEYYKDYNDLGKSIANAVNDGFSSQFEKSDALSKQKENLDKTFKSLISKQKSIDETRLQRAESTYKAEKTIHENRISDYKDEIDALKEKADAEDEIAERKKRREELDALNAKKANIEAEKNTRIFQNGQWTYQSDQAKLNDVNLEIKQKQQDFNQWELEQTRKHEEAKLQALIESKQAEIKALEDHYNLQKEQYDTFYTTLENTTVDKLSSISETFGSYFDSILANIKSKMSNVSGVSYSSSGGGLSSGDGGSSSSPSLSANATANIPGVGTVNVNVVDGHVKETGLPVGTVVSTSGGGYEITGVNDDGTYKSKKVFDTGGILNSGSSATNLSGKPERILDPQITPMFDTLVKYLPNLSSLLKQIDIKNMINNVRISTPQFPALAGAGSGGQVVQHNYNMSNFTIKADNPESLFKQLNMIIKQNT